MKAQSVHGTKKYDYSLVKYVKSNIKVRITCLAHGVFEQIPHNHLMGRGCPACGLDRRSASQRMGLEDFTSKAQSIHGTNKYDYSLAEYINIQTKVKIICPKHGVFEQRPNTHLRCGCPFCSHHSVQKASKFFVQKAKSIHDGKGYDYSLAKYVNHYADVEIICPKHGVFKQSPRSHLVGHGCQKCGKLKSKRRAKG